MTPYYYYAKRTVEQCQLCRQIDWCRVVLINDCMFWMCDSCANREVG